MVIAASLITPTSSFNIKRLEYAIKLNDMWKDGYEKGSKGKYEMVHKAVQNFIQNYDNKIEKKLLQLATNDYDYDYDYDPINTNSYYPINTEYNNVFARLLYNDKNKPPANIYDNLPLPPEYTASQDSTEYYPEQKLSGSDEDELLSYPYDS